MNKTYRWTAILALALMIAAGLAFDGGFRYTGNACCWATVFALIFTWVEWLNS